MDGLGDRNQTLNQILEEGCGFKQLIYHKGIFSKEVEFLLLLLLYFCIVLLQRQNAYL
jgi:hypothetical protein